MKQYVVVLPIMEMESAKSVVNDLKKKIVCCYFVLESDKNPKYFFQKDIDPIYIGPD